MLISSSSKPPIAKKVPSTTDYLPVLEQKSKGKCESGGDKGVNH